MSFREPKYIFNNNMPQCIESVPSFLSFLSGHPGFSGAFFLAKSFEKVSFDPCNFRITTLLARKSEQMKNF